MNRRPRIGEEIVFNTRTYQVTAVEYPCSYPECPERGSTCCGTCVILKGDPVGRCSGDVELVKPDRTPSRFERIG